MENQQALFNNISRKPVQHELDVPLNHVQLAEKAKEAGQIQADVGRLEIEFQAVKKKHQSEVGVLTEQLSEILKVCHAGVETRVVDCIEIKNFSEASVSYEYDGQILLTRTMEPHELQSEMFEEKREAPALPEAMPGSERPIDEQIAQEIREATHPMTASSAVQ